MSVCIMYSMYECVNMATHNYQYHKQSQTVDTYSMHVNADNLSSCFILAIYKHQMKKKHYDRYQNTLLLGSFGMHSTSSSV